MFTFKQFEEKLSENQSPKILAWFTQDSIYWHASWQMGGILMAPFNPSIPHCHLIIYGGFLLRNGESFTGVWREMGPLNPLIPYRHLIIYGDFCREMEPHDADGRYPLSRPYVAISWSLWKKKILTYYKPERPWGGVLGTLSLGLQPSVMYSPVGPNISNLLVILLVEGKSLPYIIVKKKSNIKNGS